MTNSITFIEKEFLLSQLMRSKGAVSLFGPGKSARCVITSFDKDVVVLETTDAGPNPFASWEEVTASLGYQGQRLAFSSKVIRVDGRRLHLALPERLLKAPQRKAVRVAPPKGLALEFYLQNDHVHMAVPESTEYLELELPEPKEGFDLSSLNGLLASFQAKATAKYSQAGVIMFGPKRAPSTLEEKIIARLGRVLLVASTKSNLPPTDPYPEGRIVTQAMADAYEGPSIFLEGSTLEKNRAEKALAGVVSEVYCPMLYYQYVIGYVYIMNDESKKVCLDFRAVDFAWEFARALAWKLKEQGYFKGDGKGKPEPHRPHVLDFSASGCLFVLPKSSYPVKLKQAAVLDLGIRAPSLDLLCKGRVVRRFEDRENEYYGVSFLGLDEGGMAALRELLYADRSSSMPSDETVYSG